MAMKLWLLEQNEQNGYDTYDSCVVAAATAEKARMIPPVDGYTWKALAKLGCYASWCSSPDKVTVTLLGTALRGTKPGVILASFNAG